MNKAKTSKSSVCQTLMVHTNHPGLLLNADPDSEGLRWGSEILHIKQAQYSKALVLNYITSILLAFNFLIIDYIIRRGCNTDSIM